MPTTAPRTARRCARPCSTHSRPAPVVRAASRQAVAPAERLALLGLTTADSVVLLASPAEAKAPTPGQIQPPGTDGLLTMLGWGGWLVSFVCVAGLLVVAAMMALKHRRGEGGGEALGSLGWVLGACVLGSAAGPLANALV